MVVISKDNIQQVVIQEFIELGFQYINGTNISQDGSIHGAIAKLNPTIVPLFAIFPLSD